MGFQLKGFLSLMGAILLEVTASLSLKAALDNPACYTVVVTGYAGAFLLLALTIRAGVPLGVAYGIWAALGVVLTAIGSHILFDEPLTAAMTLGVALIVAGVLCVEVGSKTSRKKESTA